MENEVVCSARFMILVLRREVILKRPGTVLCNFLL